MARFTAEAVYKKLNDTRLMPLFNYADAEVCKHVIKACYKSGLRVFELTNRDTMALEVFRQLIPWAEKECPDLSIGAGTILDDITAGHFIDAGADFIVAPIYDKGAAKVCRKHSIPYIPGCFTPTEMYRAYNSGSHIVKLFPGGIIGAEFVKHVLAPLPNLKIVITGGVQFDELSVKKWFAAGAFALGIGSSVFTKERILKKEFISIEHELAKIREY
jgi:2-dehydro-3-deoxyphosphogluconate aldolase / (4S)-4-hydroxy-2-oxoglutarate aldolase